MVLETAVNQAERSLDRARRAILKLENASNLDDAAEAWEDFLQSASRIYEKLRAGARGHSKSWKWFSDVQRTRQEDELLCYIHHARNADHHRLEHVAEIVPAELHFGSSGKIRVYGFGVSAEGIPWADWDPGEENAHPVFKTVAPRLRLVPVTDRGVTYRVPTRHGGSEINSSSPAMIGHTAINYFRKIIDEANAQKTASD